MRLTIDREEILGSLGMSPVIYTAVCEKCKDICESEDAEGLADTLVADGWHTEVYSDERFMYCRECAEIRADELGRSVTE